MCLTCGDGFWLPCALAPGDRSLDEFVGLVQTWVEGAVREQSERFGRALRVWNAEIIRPCAPEPREEPVPVA